MASPHDDPLKGFEQRKRDHIEHSLDQGNQAMGLSGLDNIRLRHEALPDLNFSEIDITSKRFSQTVTTPFFISSMTAGHHDAIDINHRLMQAASHCGWAMGVGSQRRQLHDMKACDEWKTLRALCPDTVLFGNIGIAQVITQPVDAILRLADSLSAQAMIVHTNPLQECIQPEGTPAFRGSWQALETLCRRLPMPVILKETGCGFSHNTLERLNNTGVAAVDVSGLGGTHWGRIEGARCANESRQKQAASSYKNWGISTVDSLCHARNIVPHYEVWGSGGVRSGLDAAKLIALGASSVGFAKPMLEAALNGTEAVIELMETLSFELKIALFCTGAQNLQSLRENHHGIER